MRMTVVPSGELQNQSNGSHDALELALLGDELLSARGRQCVIPRATIVIAGAGVLPSINDGNSISKGAARVKSPSIDDGSGARSALLPFEAPVADHAVSATRRGAPLRDA